MRRAVPTALALVIITACQPPVTELTENQIAAIADTVNGLQSEAWDAVQRVDVEDFMALWHDARETTAIVDGMALPSNSTYEMFLNASGIFNRPARPETALLLSWPSTRSHQVSIGDSRTTVLAPNVVHVMDRGRFTWTDTTGTVWPERGFTQSTVWVRRDGNWKMLFGHYSVPTPESD
jgi:hypothetical protein